jgi:hypothetical protein
MVYRAMELLADAATRGVMVAERNLYLSPMSPSEIQALCTDKWAVTSKR